MKIAIAQLNPTIGNLEYNAAQILDAAKTAAAEGAQLLLTPELALCGYPPRDLLLIPGFIVSIQQQLNQLAGQLPSNITVLVGTVVTNPNAEAEGEKPLFNSIARIENCQITEYFHKRLLPTYDVFDEHRYFAPGDRPHWFELDCSGAKVRVGVTVCEDMWNDEKFWGKRQYDVNPIADLAAAGVDVIVNLSASPYSVNKAQLREAMLNHAAVNYGLPIIYNNQIGANDDLIFDGSSVAFNRRGKVVCRAGSFGTDLATVEYNCTTKDLLPGSIVPLASTSDAEIWAALTLGVKDYARKCGFKQVVLGLSGGIDSSLVAAVAAEAMGPENVLGVMMPSPYSSEHSISDAVALVKNLGINSHKLEIAGPMQAYDTLLEPLFADTQFGVTEENLQSRIRGNLLMAIANKFGHLLLSTGNKSEMAVGYCTLYGDMNGGLAVIADVPKTRVFSLCRWLNREREIIPENIIDKPPSAELRPGQLDQDSLPPYPILDDILERFVQLHQSQTEIEAAGYEAQTVYRVIKLVAKAEFKRRQAPPGLKITDRAFGTGWRMPIASRWLE